MKGLVVLENKSKVVNLTNSGIYLNFSELDKTVVLLPPSGSVSLSDEKVGWLLGMSKIFESGKVRIENIEEVSDDIKTELPVTADAISTDEIKEYLKYKLPTFKKKVAEITREDLLVALLEHAKNTDKPVSFVETVNARLDEVRLNK